MAVEKHGYFLDPLKLRCQLAYVHSNVLSKNWWAKRGGKVILDEELSAVLDCYVIDEVHLSYWKPNFWIYNLLEFASYFVDCNHLAASSYAAMT